MEKTTTTKCDPRGKEYGCFEIEKTGEAAYRVTHKNPQDPSTDYTIHIQTEADFGNWASDNT